MGLLDELENAMDPQNNPAEVGTNNEENGQEVNSGVEFSSLEVGGVKIEGKTITDALGQTWQVPGDNVSDLDDLYAGNVYKIPESITKDFWVQMIRVDQLKEYMMRGFRPVQLKELGIPEELLKTGSPLDSYHVVGDSILMKIPHAIRDRIEAAKEKETRDRLLAMEPTEEMMKRAGVDHGMDIQHRLGFTKADPRARMGVYADDQGKVK